MALLIKGIVLINIFKQCPDGRQPLKLLAGDTDPIVGVGIAAVPIVGDHPNGQVCFDSFHTPADRRQLHKYLGGLGEYGTGLFINAHHRRCKPRNLKPNGRSFSTERNPASRSGVLWLIPSLG